MMFRRSNPLALCGCGWVVAAFRLMSYAMPRNERLLLQGKLKQTYVNVNIKRSRDRCTSLFCSPQSLSSV
jgi:hypothetical protein